MIKLESYLKPYKHVIWDWNGTLVDDVDHVINCVNPLLKEHDLPSVTLESYKEVFEFPVINYYKKLGFNFEKESFESLSKKFISNFMSSFHETDLFDGTKELLGTLKTHGKKLSVLSASKQDHLEQFIQHFGISEYFDHLFGIDNIYAASKVQRGFELIEAAKVDRAKTVLVGDTEHDFEVGHELGISVILVSHGHQSKERLQKRHDTVVDLFK